MHITSDNGMPFPRVKGQMYEADFKLPLAVSWKSVSVGERVVDDLVGLMDLAPTFLEAAGLKVHSQMFDKSLMEILESDRFRRQNRPFPYKRMYGP
jgi:N-sulfoglucosamine sulfohydrolase